MSYSALVVDDSMLVRHSVCRYLEARGFSVETATNGVDALRLLERLRPDLIITDVMMPRMDGAELIRRIRSSESLKHTPLLVLTSKSSSEAVENIPSLYVVHKNVDIEEQLDLALSALLVPQGGSADVNAALSLAPH
jgi:CheY-like chemotaxis protein